MTFLHSRIKINSLCKYWFNVFCHWNINSEDRGNICLTFVNPVPCTALHLTDSIIDIQINVLGGWVAAGVNVPLLIQLKLDQ